MTMLDRMQDGYNNDM